MTTKWSHLPNAAHVDAVIASLKANPEEWDAARYAAWYAAWNAAWGAAWDAAWDAAYSAAWNAAYSAARDAARDAAWNAAYDAAWGAAWYAARNAVGGTILALIAFDDCAHLLDSEPDELRVLSKLGVDAATLMIPAATAFKLIREKQLAVL